MQRTNIEFERQRHLANWLVKSSPHMAAAAAAGAAPPTAAASTGASASASVGAGGVAAAAQGAPGNSAAACNGAPHGHMTVSAAAAAAAAAEARKPKLRRFNSHDTSSNMFSVADFENARLARRNEIELKQRLARRQRNSANGSYGLGGATGAGAALAGGSGTPGSNAYNSGYNGFCGGLNGSGDYSTGDSKTSKCSSSSEEPLPADVFLERYSLPRVVRIVFTSKSSNETLQSSSSHGSSTAASSSSSAGIKPQPSSNNDAGGSNTGTGTTSSSSAGSGPVGHDELFLLYRLVKQRHIYHGYNAKSQASQRKKTVLIPQEFPGYFSLLNEKGLPLATQYGSLMQLVRERVYKFASVDNMPAFSESTPSSGQSGNSPSHEGCLPGKNRPQYVKTTARGGQVFRLLAVFEDGKQEHGQHQSGNLGNCNKSHVSSGYMGRDKEKGRYAQLLNEQRQVMYVPLSTKGKFYEIEPGIPQLLQKQADPQRKLNTECVHRLGALVSASKQLPLMLRYIAGPAGTEIPEQLCISQLSKEDIVIACPIEEHVDAAGQTLPLPLPQPLQLRKLYLSREMQLLKCLLGFDSEQRMLANAQVQNMLKFCQFNCDQFLKLVEIELLQRSETRSGSKTREGLKILKPLHLPKLLRREKSSMAGTSNSSSAHEKEDSIIFLSKNDLEQLEAKEAAAAAAAAAASLNSSESSTQSANRITERMKVFQSTKKKWFRKPQQQQQQQQTQLEEDKSLEAKRMSMERYTDMSKLLQERFGNANHELNTTTAAPTDTQSLHSETETTTLSNSIERSSMPKSLDTLLQKSMSLQDIELLNGPRQQQQRPDLLLAAQTDTISEAGTELEDVENQTPPPQSFITEKLYNEFHVKTRQYSKSSSSLHQLRHFSQPQKMQLHETEREKRSLAQFKAQQLQQQQSLGKEPITGRRAAGGVSLLGGLVPLTPSALLSPSSLVEDDLPYSSVRDSLVMSSLGSDDQHSAEVEQQQQQRQLDSILPHAAAENIYAEICASHTCDSFSRATQPTLDQVRHNNDEDDDDDDGDYASLRYQPQSVSRVEINCAPATSAISYHTVYLGEEPLGERHAAAAAVAAAGQHITTVELAGEDNIYNTLK